MKTHQEEVTKGQVKSGGSPELIYSLSKVFAGVLVIGLLMFGCGPSGTENTSVGTISDVQSSQSSILSAVSVGQIFYHKHVDARIEVMDISGSTVSVAIGINGSQKIAVDFSFSQFEEDISDNDDWSRNASLREDKDNINY